MSLFSPAAHLNKLAPYDLKLRFFDQELYFRLDSARHAATFAQMYRRFQIDCFGLERPPLQFTLLTQPNNPWHKPALISPQGVHLFNNPAWLEWYVYETVLAELLQSLRSHFLFHAGVVAYQDQGVIIVANSTYGKTTLTLELVRRGFSFLSDESAAVSRADKQVYPFPRSLNIRPGTLELVGLTQRVPAGAPTWLDKLVLDIETLRPGSLGQASPIHHLIILQDPDAPTATQAGSELRLIFDHLDESFVTAVSQLETVTAVNLDRQMYRYPLLQLQTTEPMAAFAQVETLAHRHQLLLSNLGTQVDRPSFKGPVRLEPIPRSLAARTLLTHFQGGHNSALLRTEFNGSGTGLFMELVSLISATRCYKLSVGPLAEMADLICGLVDL